MAALVLDKEAHWLFCAEVCLLPWLLPLCPAFLPSVASLTLHFLSTGLLVQNIYCFMQILESPVSIPQKGRNTARLVLKAGTLTPFLGCNHQARQLFDFT